MGSLKVDGSVLSYEYRELAPGGLLRVPRAEPLGGCWRATSGEFEKNALSVIELGADVLARWDGAVRLFMRPTFWRVWVDAGSSVFEPPIDVWTELLTIPTPI